MTLRNQGEQRTRFAVRIAVPWLTVTPADGALAPGESVDLRFSLDSLQAPQGEGMTTVRVAGRGRTLEIEVRAQVANPPPVISDATRLSTPPCEDGVTTTVSATVTDDTGLAAVTLRWTTPDGAEGGQARRPCALRAPRSRCPFAGAPRSRAASSSWWASPR